MGSFRCYDNSDVIAALMMTNCHLNTTVVAIFPNVCLRRRIEPPSYARTAYVVVIWPSFLLDSFVKISATWNIFWANGLPLPSLAKNFPYAYAWETSTIRSRRHWPRGAFWSQRAQTLDFLNSPSPLSIPSGVKYCQKLFSPAPPEHFHRVVKKSLTGSCD